MGAEFVVNSLEDMCDLMCGGADPERDESIEIIGIDFTENEVKAIERVSGWEIPDDADMRHAIHDMVVELSRLKDIDISDIDLDEEIENLY